MTQSILLEPVKRISKLIKTEEGAHVWQFSRVGGVNRVNLQTGKDIMALSQLDQKLWTALSCPVHGLEIDAKTLELIDTDGDGRIRVAEVLNAIEWVVALLKNPDDIIKNKTHLPLSAIDDTTEAGQKILASAKQILVNLGKEDANEISVAETSDVSRIFANTQFNGDGLITEDSTESIELKTVIAQIIQCLGGTPDRNGNTGISLENILNFYHHLEDYAQWYESAQACSQNFHPFSIEDPELCRDFLVVKSKIDDFFLRCRLTEYDMDATEALNTMLSHYTSISQKELSNSLEDIGLLPISKIKEQKSIFFNQGMNPYWAKPMAKFKERIFSPLFPGQSELSLDTWELIVEKFEVYQEWLSKKKGEIVESLGYTVIQEMLAKNDTEELISLIQKDVACEQEANSIFEVDKLVRLYCDLFTLLKNFVNFSDLYSNDSHAVFQVGSLYIDQRCCDLCIKVDNLARHQQMAGASGICLLYCECYSKSRDEKMTIVAALTDGDIDNISIGRNGIFYDRKGEDWDATIIKIIDNPISIRQAFWSPYKKLSKFISTQIEKVASSKEKEVDQATSTQVVKATSTIDMHLSDTIGSKSSSSKTLAQAPSTHHPTQAAPAPAFDIGKFVGIFAAISLALGAIGSVIISVLAGFFKLAWWEMPLAIVGVILAISLPSMIIAYIKLRKRNLAPVLDANGWAINARITINILFGRTLTHLASLPLHAKINVIDPFSKKKRPIFLIISILLILVGIVIFLFWHFSLLEKIL